MKIDDENLSIQSELTLQVNECLESWIRMLQCLRPLKQEHLQTLGRSGSSSGRRRGRGG